MSTADSSSLGSFSWREVTFPELIEMGLVEEFDRMTEDLEKAFAPYKNLIRELGKL
jgi:hypothetical protein